MMNQQQQQVHPAAVACEFMQRADLKGKEVEIFAQTYNWLQAILEGELAVVPAKDWDEMKGKLAEEAVAAMHEVTGEPMEVTPENEPVGEDIPILEPDDDSQGAVDPVEP